MGNMRIRVAAGALAVGLSCTAQAQKFELLNPLPGAQGGGPLCVSSAGTYAAGTCSFPNFESQPTYWNAGAVPAVVPMPPVKFNTALAYGITESGVVAWTANNPTGGGQTGYRSEIGGSFLALKGTATLPETNAAAISDDGSVIAGLCWKQSNQYAASRWDAGGNLELLPAPAGYTTGHYAHGLSGNGQVTVGKAWSATLGKSVGVRWNGTSVTTITHPSFGTLVEAEDADFDGDTVVGLGLVNDNSRAYRWTESGGTQILPMPSGGYNWSGATSVSGDGKWVVGYTSKPNGPSLGYIYSDAIGGMLLQDYLATVGVNVPAGWMIGETRGISTDGTTIVGSAFDPSGKKYGFRAVVPVPGTLVCVAAAGLCGTRRRRPQVG